MKTGHHEVSLGNLLRLERRPIKVRPTEAYQEIGIYCFGRGIFHKPPRSGLEVGDKPLFQLKESDFILQVTFAWEGAVALVSAAEDGMYGSTRYPTFRVDEERCIPKFLLNYFKTEEGLQQLVKICPGSAGRNRVLSIRRIPEVLVPLPPLEEQRRLVSRIDELAADIGVARSLRRDAEEESARLSERGAASIFDRVEQRFAISRLGNAVTVCGGGTPSTTNPFYWSGEIPWISPKDMKVREIHDSIDHISEQATEESAAKLLDPGAVLIVVRGMILAHTVPSAVLRVTGAINQDMKALVPSAIVLPEYLCAFLWARNARILALVEKSTHDTRKLETSKILDLMIPIPPVKEQRQIVDEVGVFQSQVESLRKLQSATAAELDALMPSILDNAFRGKL